MAISGSTPFSRRSRLLPGLVLALATACGGAPESAPLLVLSGPSEVHSFEVRASQDEVLWRIESASGRKLEQISYGVLPPTFRQLVPEAGRSPRPFLFGEPITLESITARRRFLHHGIAVSEHDFSMGAWEMQLLTPSER